MFQSRIRPIRQVLCHCKSGKMSINAKIVVDTTGDADVAAAAGVPYEVGSAEFAGLNMSTTLAFRMANVNLRRYREAMQAWHKKQTSSKQNVHYRRSGRKSREKR